MRPWLLLGLVALAACDRPVHEPVKVIAEPRPAVQAQPPALVVPEPAASAPAAPAAVASGPDAARRAEPIRRPGFIPADQLPMRQGAPGESGNEAFKRAIAERLCKGQQASGVPCN